MGDFAADTEIVGADGRYRARLSRDWEIWGPNGGYVAAIALRAAGASAPLPWPAAFSCHFLSVAQFGDVELQVTPLRTAKRAASLRVAMTQNGRAILDAMVWVVGDVGGLEHDVAPMPDVPPPRALQSMEDLLGPEIRNAHPFWQNLERRPLGWVPAERWKPTAPLVRNWMRFRPRATFAAPFLDAGRTLLLIDTMTWPAAWRAHGDTGGYLAPSLDVNVQFHRSAPASEWLFVEATAPVATRGLVGGQARIWASDGQLLASGGGQLLCRPVPA